jgi:hypothetical protein
MGVGCARMIPTRLVALAKALARGDCPMKTIGWAAIVYSVHDAYTFGALVLLVAGELAAAYASGRRVKPNVRKKLSTRRLSRN